MITADDIRRSHLKVALFADGARGMAAQVHQCVEFPRLTRVWRRENRDDEGSSALFVDGERVADLDAAAAALNGPDPGRGNDFETLLRAKP